MFFQIGDTAKNEMQGNAKKKLKKPWAASPNSIEITQMARAPFGPHVLAANLNPFDAYKHGHNKTIVRRK